jgi:hypothetical protein
MADVHERKQGTQAHTVFRDVGNANEMQQAGEEIDATRSPAVTPGDRLTGSELKAKMASEGRPSTPHGADDRSRALNDEAKADEREAMRRQGEHDTDSNLEPDHQPDGDTALIDPVITSNPD